MAQQDTIPTATVIDMLQELNRTVQEAFNRTHIRIDKVEGDLKTCQERRNLFHQNTIPEYNQHIKCAKNKKDGWDRIKQSVVAGLVLLIVGQSAAVIYYLHGLIERIAK